MSTEAIAESVNAPAPPRSFIGALFVATILLGSFLLFLVQPMVARMADACPGKVTFFACDRNHRVMAMHRAQGKRIIYLDGDAIVASEGSFTHRIPLARIPVTQNGAIGFQIENAMASIAALTAVMSVPPARLTSTRTTLDPATPGFDAIPH